jgi:hypothetical protein
MSDIAAVLHLGWTVVGYLNDVKGASENCSRILTEATNAIGLLYILSGLVDKAGSEETWLDATRSLGVPSGPLEQFKLALERLATRLGPAAGLSKGSKKLVWPFKEKEVLDILNTIERQKTLFMIAIHNDHM